MVVSKYGCQQVEEANYRKARRKDYKSINIRQRAMLLAESREQHANYKLEIAKPSNYKKLNSYEDF